MGDPRERRPTRNAGAFLGPNIMVPIPMRTLSDDLDDEGTRSDAERELRTARRGLIRRLIARVRLSLGG